MYAVLFEVTPNPGKAQRYFDIAAGLVPILEKIDGFVSIERFQSLTRPDVFLSLSYWRDEQAIATWRSQAYHRESQRDGRDSVFLDYRIRVVSVVRDYSFQNRQEAPTDSNTALSAPIASPLQ